MKRKMASIFLTLALVFTQFAIFGETAIAEMVELTSITECNITVDSPNRKYTGETIIPNIYIRDYGNSKNLVQDVDYTVSYENSQGESIEEIKNIGNYKILVTGIDGYKDTVKCSFSVYEPETKNIADNSYRTNLYFNSGVNYRTDGNTYFVVTDGKKVITPYADIRDEYFYFLRQGTEYELKAYDSNNQAIANIQDCGEYKVLLQGVGEYDGSIEYTVVVGESYPGAPIVQEGGNIALCGIDADSLVLRATGSAVEPEIDLYHKDTGIVLKKDRDYSIAYFNEENEEVASVVNEGIYKAVFTGKGKYNGTMSLKFRVISQEDFNISKTDIYRLSFGYSRIVGNTFGYSSSEEKAVVYTDGLAIFTPYIYIEDIAIDKSLNRDKDYTQVVYDSDNNIVANIQEYGIYTVKLTGKGNYTGEVNYTIEVVAEGQYPEEPTEQEGGDIALCRISSDSLVMRATGEALEPAIYLYDGNTGRRLQVNTDYTMEYTNEAGEVVDSIVEAGTYKAAISGKGKYNGTMSLKFLVLSQESNDISDDECYRVSLSCNSVGDYGRYYGNDNERKCTFVTDGVTIITPYIYLYDTAVGTSLSRNYDYTSVAYDSEGNAVVNIQDYGTYRVVATGKGDYTGTVEYTVVIAERGGDEPDEPEVTNYAGYGITNGEQYEWTKVNNSIYYNLSEGGTLTVSGEGQFSASMFNSAAKSSTIKKIVIGKYISRIYFYSSDSFNNLEAFEVEDGSKYFRAIDGVLYNASGEVLMKYPTAKPDKKFIIPATVRKISSSSGNSRIYNGYVFSRNPYLEEVQFTGSISKWDTTAFYSCKGLKKVLINAKLKTLPRFESCSNLEEVLFSDETQIEQLSSWCFGNCSNLKNVSLPTSLKTICSYAFYDCSALTAVALPEGLENINRYAFRYSGLKSIEIPDTVSYIGRNVFADCANLTYAKWPVGTHTVPSYSFAWDNKLAKVDLPDGIEKINSYAFYDCGTLKEIIMPTQLITIGRYAFSNCYSLKSVSMPSSLVTLGDAAFAWSGIENLEFKNTEVVPETEHGLEVISAKAFEGTNIRAVSLPNTVRTIAYDAFRNTYNLNTIDLSNTEIIEKYAFDNSGIENLVLPNSIRNIGYAAFHNARNLSVLDLGKIQTLDASAFDGCNALSSLMIPDTLSHIGEKAFYIDKLMVYFSNTVKNLPDMNDVFKYNDILLCNCGNDYEKAFKSGGLPILSNHKIKSGECEICGHKIGSIIVGLEKKQNSIWRIDNVDYTCYAKHYYLPVGESEKSYICFEATEYRSDKNDTLDNREAVVKNLLYVDECPSSINIPSVIDGYNVAGIDSNAFSNGESIKELTVPESVYYIENGAFNSLNLNELTIPVAAAISKSYVDSIRNLRLYGEGIIPEYSDTSYKNSFWYINRSAIDKITLMEGITEIGDYAFCNQSNVVEYELPDSVTEIGDNAFYRNKALETVSGGEGIQTIGYEAFAECPKLESMSLTSSLKKMQYNSFAGDDELVLTVPEDSYALSAAKNNKIKCQKSSGGSVITPTHSDDDFVIECKNMGCKNGETIAIPVYVISNPGIVAVGLELKYNKDAFDFVGIENGLIFANDPIYDSESCKNGTATVAWEPETNAVDIISTGQLLTLKLKAKANVISTSIVADSYDIACGISESGKAINSKLNRVDSDVISGKASIAAFDFGDVDKDGDININDVTYLMRYISKWNGYTLSEGQKILMDVCCDGRVDLADVLALKRKIAGWDDYKQLPVIVQ